MAGETDCGYTRSVASPALWLYRSLMVVATPLAAPFLWLADRRRGKSRPPWRRRFGHELPAAPHGGVWIQAVSVGEVQVARPLMAELRRRRGECPIVLSATTATGLALASGAHQADVVLPFPIDLPGPVTRFLDHVAPHLVILIETELWPELLAACGQRDIPVALVNARVSDASFRGYRAIRRLLAPLLKPITLALAQDQVDAERLAAIGVVADRIQVTGNIKFDIKPPGQPLQVAAAITRLAAGRPVWIAGSTMAGEDEAVLAALARIPRDRRPFLILAPRHPERATAVLDLAAAAGVRPIRRTRIDEDLGACDAVVLDTVGELAGLYQLASIAFIGGSLVPTGGHNPIEAARFAVPVLSGEHVKNFRAVFARFAAAGAVRFAHDSDGLSEALNAWLADPAAARAAGEAGRALLLANSGATERTVDVLAPLLP